MPYGLRTFTCPDCGEQVERRAAEGATVRCTRDAIKFSAEVQRQLHNHEGPYWEKWKWRYAASARRLIASPGPGESLTKAS